MIPAQLVQKLINFQIQLVCVFFPIFLIKQEIHVLTVIFLYFGLNSFSIKYSAWKMKIIPPSDEFNMHKNLSISRLS